MTAIYERFPLSVSLFLPLGPASETFVRDLVSRDSSRSRFPPLTYSDSRPLLIIISIASLSWTQSSNDVFVSLVDLALLWLIYQGRLLDREMRSDSFFSKLNVSALPINLILESIQKYVLVLPTVHSSISVFFSLMGFLPRREVGTCVSGRSQVVEAGIKLLFQHYVRLSQVQHLMSRMCFILILVWKGLSRRMSFSKIRHLRVSSTPSTSTITWMKRSMYDRMLSSGPCMILLKTTIVTGFLFWEVKWADSQLQRSIHDSMQPSGRLLSHNLVGPTNVNVSSLHLKASSTM